MGFLNLSRKVGERIILTSDDGERMEVLLTRIGPNCARLAIDAPKRWTILREELVPRPPVETIGGEA